MGSARCPANELRADARINPQPLLFTGGGSI